MKKIVCLLFCLVMALSVLAACTPEHEHTFDTKWMNDAAEHWHQATCEHTEEVADKAPHEDANGDDICDVCGYIAEHEHTYETTWSWNETTHYHKNSCGHADVEKYRSDIAAHVDNNNDSICDVCTYDYDHEHTYATEWTPAANAADGHWHAATCGHDVAGADLTDHIDADNDAVCDECGWDYDHEHTYAEEFTTDANEHWREVTCGHDIPAGEKNIHKDADGDKKCDACGYEADHFHTTEEKWTTDDDQHWHALTCHPELGLKADAAAHEGFQEDGICDICNHVVFEIYTITVDAPKDVAIVNEGNSLLTLPFKVKEGNELVFYVRLTSNQRFEEIKGAVWDPTPSEPIEVVEGEETVIYYLYKVTLTPTADTTIKLTINNLKTFDVIVDGQTMNITENKAGYVFKNITFNAPEAGTYVIMALSPDDVDLHFGSKNAPESGYSVEDYQKSYTFQVSKAGEFTVKAKYFVNAANTEYTPKYYILRLEDDIVLPAVQGTGYTLPTNTDVVATFTMPSAGLYHITSSNAANSNTFTWNGTVGNMVIKANYAGEVITLTIRNDIDNVYSFDFDWEIIKLESEGTLVLNKDNNVEVDIGYYHTYTFTATKSGTYTFTAGTAQTAIFRFYNFWSEDAPVTECEHNASNTFTSYYSQNYAFIAPAGTEISINGGKWQTGEVIQYLAEDRSVEYKVRYSGAVRQEAIELVICAYLPSMRSFTEVELTAGQTIDVYIINNTNTQQPAEEPFQDTVRVEYKGYNVKQDANGNPYLVPGVSWNFRADEKADYTFTAAAGALVSIDGGKTWHKTVTAELKANGTATLMVKNEDGSNAKSKITIGKVAYKQTMTVGEHSYTFKPGKEYSVTLTGSLSLAEKLPYTLSWTDSNIVVKLNGTKLTSGTDIDYDPNSDELLIQYNGTAEAAVKFSLADRYEAPAADTVLYLGENSVLVISGTFGKEMVFVAEAKGEYTIKPAGGESNLKVLVNGVAVDLAEGYTFQLEQGASQSFTITTADGSNNAYVNLVIEQKIEAPDWESDPLWALLTGEYKVYTEASGSDPVLQFAFVQNSDGTITLNLQASRMFWNMGVTTGTYTVTVADQIGKLVDADGITKSYYFMLNDSGSLVFYVSSTYKYVLKSVVIPNGTALNMGNNNLTIADGYWGDAYYFTAPETGTYIFSIGDAADAPFLGIPMADGSDISWIEEMPYITAELKRGESINFKVATLSGEAGAVCLVIEQHFAQVVEGSNRLDIPEGYEGDRYIFKAPADGTYIFSEVTDVEKPYVAIVSSNMSTNIDLPHSITMTVGQTIHLQISTDSTKGGYVTILVESAGVCEHTWSEDWTVENGRHWHAPTCSCGKAGNKDEANCSDWNDDTLCDKCSTKLYSFHNVTLTLPEGGAMYDENYELSTDILPVQIKSNNPTIPAIYLPNSYDLATIVIEGGTLSNSYMEGKWIVLHVRPNTTDADSQITVTAEKLSKVAQQIASGTLTIEAQVEMEYVYKPLVFRADKAGIYMVSSENYMPLALTDGGDFSNFLTIEVTAEQAGTDITVYGAYTWYGYGSNVYEGLYSVSFLGDTDIVLPAAQGSGYLLSNGFTYNVTVSLNEPGLYKVTTTAAASWYLNGTNMADTFIAEVKMDEDGKCELKLGLSGYGGSADFELDWTVELLPLSYVDFGQNDLWLVPYAYQGYQFYAPEGGSYLFTTGSEDAVIYAWNGTEMVSQGGSYIASNMLKGDTVTFYVVYYGEPDEGSDTAVQTLNASALGFVPVQNEDTGAYHAMVGTLNAFVAPEKGGYKITVTGGKICVDGTNWVTEIQQCVLGANDVLYYMVQADNATVNSVALTFEKIFYGFELTVDGQNTHTVKPGLDYEVTISGLEGTEQFKYQLSWPAELNITVTNEWGEPIVNGGVSASYGQPVLIVSNNGDADVEIAFVLVDMAPGAFALAEGSQSVTLEAGRDYYVTLPSHEMGDNGLLNYILIWSNTDGVTVQYYVPDADWEPVYDFAVSGMEIGVIDDFEYSVLFISNTTDTDLQVSFTLELTEGMAPGSNLGDPVPVSQGETELTFTNSWALVSFTAPSASKYCFSSVNYQFYLYTQPDDAGYIGTDIIQELAEGETITLYVENPYGSDDCLLIEKILG